MTENEALKELNECIGKCVYGGCYGTAMHTAIIALNEIQQYRAIGTIEECREARGRQTGKIPKLHGDYEDGRLLCPNCDENLMDLAECGFDYCPYCGQKLDWTE